MDIISSIFVFTKGIFDNSTKTTLVNKKKLAAKINILSPVCSIGFCLYGWNLIIKIKHKKTCMKIFK